MADVNVNHSFTSLKAQSPDTTLVSKNEWNDEHEYAGGTNGQIPVADSTSDTGARWTDGPQSQTHDTNYAGASPSGDMATTTVTFTSPAFLICWVSVAVTTSNGSAATVTLYRDGAAAKAGGALGTGIDQPAIIHMFGETPGSHQYKVIITTQGGATITASGARLIVLKIGA